MTNQEATRIKFETYKLVVDKALWLILGIFLYALIADAKGVMTDSKSLNLYIGSILGYFVLSGILIFVSRKVRKELSDQ